MSHTIVAAIVIGCVSLLYATAGQAGGTAFLAVMAFFGFAAGEMRPTALLLNIVAAGYATWRLYRLRAIEWRLLASVLFPSLVTAFIGGMVVLTGPIYFLVTGVLLLLASGLMMFRRNADNSQHHTVQWLPAALVGAGAGLLSGLTGVGGGVFLTPVLVALGWASPRRAAKLSPPFILCNSILGLAGVLLAGQRIAPGTAFYAVAVLTGAFLGTIIGLRWMSERATRYALAGILFFAGLRLVFR